MLWSLSVPYLYDWRLIQKFLIYIYAVSFVSAPFAVSYCSKLVIYFLSKLCESRPDLDFYLAPTTIGSKPTWFSDCQAAISKVIQDEIQKAQPRLLPLPGFQTDYGSLDSDGIHFTPLAGISYCMHLIDSAR